MEKTQNIVMATEQNLTEGHTSSA
jgi:phospholipid-translocating ATPase